MGHMCGHPLTGEVAVLFVLIFSCLNLSERGKKEEVLGIKFTQNTAKLPASQETFFLCRPALTACFQLRVFQRREAYPSENSEPRRAEEASAAK